MSKKFGPGLEWVEEDLLEALADERWLDHRELAVGQLAIARDGRDASIGASFQPKDEDLRFFLRAYWDYDDEEFPVSDMDLRSFREFEEHRLDPWMGVGTELVSTVESALRAARKAIGYKIVEETISVWKDAGAGFPHLDVEWTFKP